MEPETEPAKTFHFVIAHLRITSQSIWLNRANLHLLKRESRIKDETNSFNYNKRKQNQNLVAALNANENKPRHVCGACGERRILCSLWHLGTRCDAIEGGRGLAGRLVELTRIGKRDDSAWESTHMITIKLFDLVSSLSSNSVTDFFSW